MKKVILYTLVALCCTSLSFSQKALGIYHQYQEGYSQADVRLGLGSVANIFNIGFDYDYCLKSGNIWGPGSFHVGASVDFSGAGQGTGTYVPFGVHAGYHLGPMMDNSAWDPFINLGLIYLYYHYKVGNTSYNASAVDLQFIFGVNYYFQKDWFALASYGYNSSGFSVGIGHAL